MELLQAKYTKYLRNGQFTLESALLMLEKVPKISRDKVKKLFKDSKMNVYVQNYYMKLAESSLEFNPEYLVFVSFLAKSMIPEGDEISIENLVLALEKVL